MKQKIKLLFAVLFVISAVLIMTSCSKEATPYEINDSEDYNVSIKYDANGGVFTTNTYVIVDSYNLSDLDVNGEGKAELALLSPDSSNRGNDAFTAINNGHFLAGWYTERTENSDGTYSYSGKWDFETGLLEIDPNKEYTSEEPVLTLYAVWVPMFKIEFCSAETGEVMDSITYDPTATKEILIPQWDEKTGAIEMYQFPKRSGYTFEKAYYDAEKTVPVETEAVVHPGKVNYENGTAEDSVLKLYVEWAEGEWYHIYNTKQLIDNASLEGCYDIRADLDFADEIWPTVFMYGNFSGKIQGNGHKISNVEVIQTNNSKVNAGLFGALIEGSEVSDVVFENVVFTIKSGARKPGTTFGLFAGSISKDAKINAVSIIGSELQIDSSCYFASEDYSIGLVCGTGDASVIENAEIACKVVGEEPEKMTVSANGNAVSIEFAQ